MMATIALWLLKLHLSVAQLHAPPSPTPDMAVP
jgi:hypothetical protein